jgi:glycosyltransferase involved in cell wall biosynthesis
VNILKKPLATPEISVVMPSMNQNRFIREAIESVVSQRGVALELIVQDGGSTDGTLETLRDLAHAHAGLSWSSEADTGPAQAINRALRKASGELIGWLNSDDLYADSMLMEAAQLFETQPDLVMVYGHGEHIDEAGATLGTYPTVSPPFDIKRFGAGCHICQPTVVFRSSLLETVGELDERLNASFDFDLWLRVFRQFEGQIGFVDRVQAYSRLHDDCITNQQRRRVAIEGLKVTARHLGEASAHWLTTYLEEYAEERGWAV